MLEMGRKSFFVWIAPAAVVAGCNLVGGLNDYERVDGPLPGDPTSGTSGTGAAGTGGTSVTSSGTGGTGGGTGGAGGLPGTGGAGGMATSSTTSTSSGGPIAEVFCTTTAIPCAPGEVCCYYPGNPGMTACGAPGSCGAVEMACNDNLDCPAGMTCCGTYNGANWTDMDCQATCNQADERIMCYGDPGACPPNKACLQSSVGNGYSYCQL
jgi:hypothetical protein